ncbi:MAG: class I SAM-dependent methyltransferase [Theionarchaea archaeon]|nr:class I SAM-dependent methyltransferase [Theionarchaea archaeon]
MNGKKIVKEGYNTIAPDYLKIRHQNSADVQLLHDLVQRLPRRAKVLDAGCGAGVPITKFLSQFFEVTGVDFAEAQIELARTLVPEAHFLCQDITELNFPECSFDAICSYYTLIHIPREEHQSVLLNFRRMLTPKGLLLLCMGADDIEDDIADYWGVPMYWSHYDADTNIEMIKECGFSIFWSKIVEDSTDPESSHLFVLGQNKKNDNDNLSNVIT